MISLINLAVLFAAKVADNALSTTKTMIISEVIQRTMFCVN